MEIYLAQTCDKRIKDAMTVFLAGEHTVKNGRRAMWARRNILESFFYARSNSAFPRLIDEIERDNFLLDSGAFTFMCAAKTVDWDEYVKDYATFINRYKITKFFELDIDSIVGLTEVERLRAKLERLTGKQCIPVWHKGRGKDYFLRMVEEYKYVALGGIVTKEIPHNIYEQMFPWFIEQAHQHGAKIHGLGYTKVENLKRFKFDSVDSTAWLYGNRGGYLYLFDPAKGNFDKVPAPANSRLSSSAAAQHNFLEWIKFQQYAKTNL